jgi:hypothetical protein
MSSHFEDVLINNVIQEIDWLKTCKFIKKGESNNYFHTSDKDNIIRSYKIKNLIKEQPTYGVLYERRVNTIDNPYCMRCYNRITQTYEEESWEHVWICNENEFNEVDILYNTLEELENGFKNDDQESYKKLRNMNLDIIKFLTEESKIFKGFMKIREVTRGLVNVNLIMIGKLKEDRKLIELVFEKLYLKMRSDIWLKRCDKNY